MSPSGEEFMAAAVLSDDDDPTRLSWDEVEKSWGSWYSFMRSYCLKPWDQEDCEEALAISRALKQSQDEQIFQDVVERLTEDKDETSSNQASGGATNAVTYKECEEALAISHALKQDEKYDKEKIEQDECVLLDGMARLGLAQDKDESSSAEASGGAIKAVTYKDLPNIGKWIKWNDGEEFIAEVFGYEDDYAGYCQNLEKSVKVKFVDRREDTLCQTELEEYNWSYCEAPNKEHRFCNACNSEDKKLQLCTGCYKVSYCDATCQRAHWKSHKNDCKREKNVLKPTYVDRNKVKESSGDEADESEEEPKEGGYFIPCIGPIGDNRPILEVEVNGVTTTMLFASGSSSNCIPEDQLKHILPNYINKIRPSRAALYWNIVGENIGEVDLDLKVGRERIRAAFCVVRNSAVNLPLANTSGHLLIGGMGLLCKLRLETLHRERKVWIQKSEPEMLLPEAEVREAAIARGWTEIAVGGKEKSYGLLRFEREGGKWLINIFCSTGAVQTTMDHPTRGRNQLDRSLKNMSELLKILADPRKHTKRGYRSRKSKPKN